MKKLLGLWLLVGAMGQTFASECLAENEEVPGEPGSPRISLNNLKIFAWKFSCTQSNDVSIAVGVYNSGSAPIAFDWDDISVAALANRSKPVYRDVETIAAGESSTSYYWNSENKLLEENDTRVTYKESISTIVGPFAYGSDKPATSTAKKLSSTSGLWYDPELSGTGFSFTDATVGLAVTYYGYDKNGGKNWLNGVTFGPKTGEAEVGKDYSINLNQPKPGNGGRFDNKPTGDASGTMAWGTMTINFTACDKATATLSGLDGTQVFNLVKLAGNAGVSCELK